MRNLLLLTTLIFLYSVCSNAQVTEFTNIDADQFSSIPDSVRPFADDGVVTKGDKGIRNVWVTNDLDQDGKPEVLITDYSNGGRVHVLELNGDKFEIVWSSPSLKSVASDQHPIRWVRSGDLDGDGKGEIIFPNQNTKTLYVYEWDGTDNGYTLALTLPEDAFASKGIGNFQMNRETALVSDIDGDGNDELIFQNADKNVYILSINGDVPGFGSWQLEGGDPKNTPSNGASFAGGSYYHSIVADINGDGKPQIINNHYDKMGFWSININGPDSYTYPDINNAEGNKAYAHMLSEDGVAYMGIVKLDVNGDGKDEIGGIIYPGTDTYSAFILHFNDSDSSVYIWDSTKIAIIASRAQLNSLSGQSKGEFWGIGAYDFNQNGRDELILGGTYGQNLVSIEYNGTGDITDPNNYTSTVLYSNGEQFQWNALTINDSAGVIDTVKPGVGNVPFVARMFVGSDINKNGKPEILAAYQNVNDSLTITYQTYDSGTSKFVKDSTHAVKLDNAINFRMFEYDEGGLSVKDIGVVTPDDYKLAQNYPNPFNPTTNIRFTLPLNKQISLKVYDILGNEVRTLLDNKDMQKGSHEVVWDGTNNYNQKVASGQYICTLKYGNFAKSIKMTLLK